MADIDHNSFHPESIALNTTLESTANDATPETSASNDLSLNPSTPAAENVTAAEQNTVQPAVEKSHVAVDVATPEPEYDAEDFAKALESFDREQAAEKDAARR